ncbi:M20/M25/M40 family metallo-hydrolase [Bombilactobacillus folatiphilus]|uniref:M20/M25/M40 family metallo-hydrolase n=1 Tax=Bombilactobacillus folatiphilus TaxID=2923362 RepID=A0ABY4P6Y8_9LACO|nr:M20/M25/M40 family metallo-hydrolase [Bombilactobacillus folatiphilus]UQS81493.1 M20/M25/M40 family metallo-hydrolase [Bombilactobacillus folatiphilus]
MVKLQDSIIQNSIQQLSDYVALPSVSAKHQKQAATAAFLKNLLEEQLGAQVQVFDDYQAPLVFAQVQPQHLSDTTLLIYNHYDVQPEEPVELWESDPFELKQSAESLIGRGVADCKGDFISRLTALKLYRQEHGDFPCNIKFLIEGEEEVASEHLSDYLAKYNDLLVADLVIWESGSKNDHEQFQIEGGNKGVLCFKLTAKSAASDLHSSLAAVADSATWRLVQALNSLRATDGTIQVPGFYEEVVAPSEIEEQLVAQAPTPDLTKKWDLQLPLLKNKSVNNNLTFAPTINIEGISSGWEGSGVKTVTPKQATAKLEFRLVPNQDPQVIFKQLTQYLQDQGFTDIQVDYLLGERGYRWDLQNPLVDRLIATAKTVYGDDKVVSLPSSAGTGPMYLLNKNTHAPIVSCGVGYSHSGPHAPNENIRINDYLQFIDFFSQFLDKL